MTMDPVLTVTAAEEEGEIGDRNVWDDCLEKTCTGEGPVVAEEAGIRAARAPIGSVRGMAFGANFESCLPLGPFAGPEAGLPFFDFCRIVGHIEAMELRSLRRCERGH
jgi:hypothetical protein